MSENGLTTVFKLFNGRKGILYNDMAKTRNFIQTGCSYKWFQENVKMTEEEITVSGHTGKFRKCYVIANGYNDFFISPIDD